MDDAIENLVSFLPEMMSLQRLKYDMRIFMCSYRVNGYLSIHTSVVVASINNTKQTIMIESIF